ncbi:hypothetical protein SETIT_1G071500v2 [Setaria italica]|uniref:Knottin scorpion toxin-like domain-containing protein n=1 Tax=Setaria italica TaxID=4555 RepID=A0A368PHZ2_SETIT|nr:hypothetical protein SETIT_1G071500v2 [Setaria italica]
MGSNNTTRAIPIIVVLVLILLSGTQADSSDALPPAMERRAGLVPPPPPLLPKSAIPDQDCPPIQVPGLIDACRRPPGLRACAAQCLIYHYRGGYCEMLPDGRPGDCFCKNCLLSSDA